ncbi:MAG TPA: gamma-glutamyl-gamma-aminobutyrate hydrolase family protein [Shinella sp.]|jgi:putative glutamine amidotransferase|uniref:gamma-glutamyl-gamma-aminobutyrate hydrolase family protein n=1 Tax=Shinella sp. TaxID=1870904 RepID=UPI002E15FC00|nr:gamma-glutamyl-gamma-aminobutyrate hydrolase family protein [Shinella sp.]
MSKPVVAIPADIREIEGNVWQATPNQYVRAAVKGANVTVFLVPALETDNDFDGILDRVDGLLVSGSRTNVHPSLYGREATDAEGPYDPARDATSLPLIRRALERGIPLLAICRGIQELNVVLGGTLANEIQEQPGMWDHRKPDTPVLDVAYGIRQTVTVKEGSCLAAVLGAGDVQVNSLHRQAISEIAPRLAVEAVADDGTIEAVSVIGAKAFAVGVQWHPEYWVGSDQPSNSLFAAFGEAVRDYAAAKQGLAPPAEADVLAFGSVKSA